MGSFKEVTFYPIFCDHKVVNESIFEENFEFAVADSLEFPGKDILLDEKYQCKGDEEI